MGGTTPNFSLNDCARAPVEATIATASNITRKETRFMEAIGSGRNTPRRRRVESGIGSATMIGARADDRSRCSTAIARTMASDIDRRGSTAARRRESELVRGKREDRPAAVDHCLGQRFGLGQQTLRVETCSGDLRAQERLVALARL